MEFEWDEAKCRYGIEKHGVDMLYAALIFEGPVLTVVDDRKDYGEVTRIISGWKGGRNDRRRYEAGLAGGPSPDEGRG